MKIDRLFAALTAAVLAAGAANAQPAAPAAAASCGACHGANGVSAIPTTPNLAGQKAPYLESALKAYRSKDRVNPVMNPMTGALTDADIQALASYYSALPAGG